MTTCSTNKPKVASSTNTLPKKQLQVKPNKQDLEKVKILHKHSKFIWVKVSIRNGNIVVVPIDNKNHLAELCDRPGKEGMNLFKAQSRTSKGWPPRKLSREKYEMQ
jgi:hypothetical protein